MKWDKISLTLILLFIPLLVNGTETASRSDSIIVNDSEAIPGEQAIIKIEMVNSKELGALTIPLIIRLHRAKFDSVSFIGSRVEYWSMKPVTITAEGQLVIFGAICMMEDYLPPGRGLLAELFITVTDSANADPIVIDSTTIHPASLIFAKSDSHTYLPAFVAGRLTIGMPLDSNQVKD